MKSISFIASLLFATCLCAQLPQSGIYPSFGEWQASKPIYSLRCEDKANVEVNDTDVMGTGLLLVKQAQEKVRLNKDSLYAWVNCDGTMYRFQARESYTVLEKGPIWIYEKLDRVQNGKSYSLEKHFFFSLNGQTTIAPLNKTSLKKALPGKTQLHLMMDMLFQTEQDAAIYDTHAKMFKINALFSVYPYH